MKITTTILILGFAAAVLAEPVDVDSAFFHPAASMYIHGDATSASNLVAQGLSIFPEDGKLLRLKELLEQQEEQKQNEDNQDQQNQQDQNQDEQEQNKDEQDQNKENPPQDEQQDDQKQEQDEQAPEPEPPRAEQMSQDEAERLLDAMKQEEENKRLQMHPVMGRPVKVDKDW